MAVTDKGTTAKPIESYLDVEELRNKFSVKELQQATASNLLDLIWKGVYYSLRTLTALVIITMLALTIWFTFWLVNGVGTGRLIFIGYETFLNIVAGEIVINILGLVAIFFGFLYPVQSKKI